MGIYFIIIIFFFACTKKMSGSLSTMAVIRNVTQDDNARLPIELSRLLRATKKEKRYLHNRMEIEYIIIPPTNQS